jgi:hypothetical protein
MNLQRRAPDKPIGFQGDEEKRRGGDAGPKNS